MRRGCALGLLALLGQVACKKIVPPSDPHFVDTSLGLPEKGQWRERVAVADLDGDGRTEIIAAPPRGEGARTPHIWSYASSGEWREVQAIFPEYPYDYGTPDVADFDGDSKPDIAVASHTQGVAVLLARDDSRWELANHGLPNPGEFPARAVSAGDLNADGRADLAVLAEVSSIKATNPLGVRVFLNAVKGESVGWSPVEIPGLERPFGNRILVRDLIGDANPEILIGSAREMFTDIVWSRQNGEWKSMSEGIGKERLHVGVDTCDAGTGKGRSASELYLVVDGRHVRDDSGPRVFGFTNERWVSRSEGLPTFGARDVTAGDFDRDGKCDLAAADLKKFSVRIFRRQGGQTWKEWTALDRPVGVGGILRGLATADVDGDGHDDLIANYASGDGSGGIRVWLSRL